MQFRHSIIPYAILGTCILSGCSPSAGPLTQNAVRESVAADKAAVYQHAAVAQALTLEDALARALRYNLDTKVAEMEELIGADDVTLDMLNALPSINGKVARVGRSNKGGSSSFSLLTGTESLQPSISTEQYRNTQQLTMEWNLLNAGINIGRAYSSSDRVLIAQERRRKVYHDVVQDTYAAYWRVAAAQSVLPVIDDLLAQSKAQLKRIDDERNAGLIAVGQAQQSKSMLQEKRKELMSLKESLSLSEIELKTLIDYPLNEKLTLDLGGQDWLKTGRVPNINGSMDDLEQTAFENRPEIREEILNKRISRRDIKMSIIETIPGAEFVLGFNRDSNKYLANSSWVDGTMALTASITKLLTLPARYNRAQNIDELSDRRRQALVAAVLTQVHVSKARFDYLNEAYQEAVEADDGKQEILTRAENFQKVGMMSQPEALNARIEAAISGVNRAFSYANLQDSYGRFVTTMGVDLWDADDANLTVPDFAKQLKRKLEDPAIFIVKNEVTQNEAEVLAQ